MNSWVRRAKCAAVTVLTVAGVTVFSGASPVQAESPPPTLTLLVDGQVIQDTSVVESGTVMTAVASSLLDPGTGTRELRIDLDDATIYQAGAVVAPEGWTVEWSTNDGATWVAVEPTPASSVTNVRATATVEAGNVVLGTQRYTKSLDASVPASTFSGSTGGDGWDVFFYDDYVLNVFHHQSTNLPLDCHLRSTGERCPGFNPTVDVASGVTGSRFPGYRSANRSGGWVDGNTGKAYLYTAEVASGAPGALCVDLNVAPPVSCGFTALNAATNHTSYQNLSNAEGVGGRLFALDSRNQQLLCFDPATDAACAGSPIDLSGGTSTNHYHVYPLDSRVFASTDTTLYCFDSGTLAPCAGWPVAYADVSWTAQTHPPVAHMDANGTIDGVCMWNGCLDLSGTVRTESDPVDWVNPHSITAWATTANTNGSAGQYGRYEASAGRAFMLYVLQGTKTPDVYCFDYATNAACDGFAEQVNDTYLYALRADPNNPTCIWYNSDPGKIGLFDAFTGDAECTANPVITLQPSAFAPRFVCQSSGGIDRWISFEMTDVTGTNPVTTQALTMRTGNGAAVPGWTDQPFDLRQVLDLSDLAIADTGARPTFNVGFNITSGTLADAAFEVIYEGRGPELCVDVVLDNTAADGAPNCPEIVALDASVTENVTGEVTEAAPNRSIVASGNATECPENIVPATPPSPPLTPEAAPSGETCQLQFTPPETDGGSPIRWYEVSDGAGGWVVAETSSDGAGGFVVEVPCPDPGSSTELSVRAVNLIGDGQPAVVSLSVPAVVATTTTTTTVAPTTTFPTFTVPPQPPVTAAPVGTLPATGNGSESTTALVAISLVLAGFGALALSRRRLTD